MLNFDVPIAPSAVNHIHGLDGLRAIAIIGVVLYHLFPDTIQGGFLGVSLFLVISGFLMMIVCERAWQKNEFSVLSFYKKRLKRIYPALFIVVLSTACFLTLFLPDELRGIRQEVLSIFGGYNNWWQISQNASYFTRLENSSAFTHLWSLSIELQYYLVWPLLFLMYKLVSPKFSEARGANIFLFAAILSAVVMFVLYRPGKDPSRIYYGTDTRCFSLFLGAYLGAIYSDIKRIRFSLQGKRFAIGCLVTCMTVLIAFCLFMNGQDPFTYRGGMFLADIFFTGVVALAIHPQLPVGKWLDILPLSWIGKRSYEIYLWYFPVISLYEKLVKTPRTPLHIFIQIAAILILSSGVHYFLAALYASESMGGLFGNRRNHA